MRFHTCYGINMGPRVHDMELQDIVDIILSIRAGAYSFEAANPRHEHEWRVWEDVKLPDDKILIPGVITQSSMLVEHPELVADRIERFAAWSAASASSPARLRLRDLRGLDGDPSEHRVGQARRPRRGRASRVSPPLGACLNPFAADSLAAEAAERPGDLRAGCVRSWRPATA